MKEDKYNVRITFTHGNGITIDCKGCGQVYLEPNHDYFFENAPMQFINYLPQLRRLGVTYRITNDKRGCYQTYNLACYFGQNPYELLGQVRRSNKAPEPIVEDEIKEEEIVTEEEIEETPDTIEDTNESETTITDEQTEESVENNEGVTETETTSEGQVEDSTDVEEPTPEVTEEPVEEVKDIETMSKQELITYAHELGLSQVSDIYTKKEIRELITNVTNNQ